MNNKNLEKPKKEAESQSISSKKHQIKIDPKYKLNLDDYDKEQSKNDK